MADGVDLAVLQHGGGVLRWAAGVGFVGGGVAHDGDRLAAALGQALERLLVSAEERRLGQQVARRIAAHRQLGQDNQLRAGFVGTSPCIDDFVRVPVKVPDCCVDLCDSNFHLPLEQVYR